jgi:hypothetical protein
VDHTASVRVLQRVGHITQDADGLIDREATLACHSGTERLPIDVRHHVVQELGGRCVGRTGSRNTGVVQRQNVWVLQRRRDLDLPQEPIPTKHGGDLRLHHLDRDLSVVLEVLGKIHDGHPTSAKLALDGVAVGQGRL